MNNYKLSGSFKENESRVTDNQGINEIIVPFLNTEGFIRYGIGNSLKKAQTNGIFPTEDGIDILCLAGMVYFADTRISRTLHSQDSWTREISITLPVYNISKWVDLSEIFTRMLNFLTGDRWNISFIKREITLSTEPTKVANTCSFDVVTLFSGGMDSLIGTINFLEQDKKLVLISHAGDSITKNAQNKLLTTIHKKYPDRELIYLDLWMVFEKKLILDGGYENSTRSRSFLFIAFGIFVLTGIKNVSVLQVPENGLIALNVPLDILRLGSHSTRTTHPFYLELWNKVLKDLGLALSIQNPYWNKTKGEMVNECLNKEFLLNVICDSISCSSPQKARWLGSAPQHCGYCVPCIIRRAAIAKAFGITNDFTQYSVGKVSDIITNHSKEKGIQLRSFQMAINRVKSQPPLAKVFIYKSGPLQGDSDHIQELADVYKRGLLEVDGFIQQSLHNES